MHVLDFVMWFPLMCILWYFIDKISNSQWTEELGSLIGGTICIVVTIVYIILFAVYPDWNWIDIFSGISKYIEL